MTQYAISCALHDYLEIACMHGYRIRITLKDNQTIEGKAIDTLTTADKREYLVLESEQKQHIELTALKKLQVLTPNAQFKQVVF